MPIFPLDAGRDLTLLDRLGGLGHDSAAGTSWNASRFLQMVADFQPYKVIGGFVNLNAGATEEQILAAAAGLRAAQFVTPTEGNTNVRLKFLSQTHLNRRLLLLVELLPGRTPLTLTNPVLHHGANAFAEPWSFARERIVTRNGIEYAAFLDSRDDIGHADNEEFDLSAQITWEVTEASGGGAGGSGGFSIVGPIIVATAANAHSHVNTQPGTSIDITPHATLPLADKGTGDFIGSAGVTLITTLLSGGEARQLSMRLNRVNANGVGHTTIAEKFFSEDVASSGESGTFHVLNFEIAATDIPADGNVVLFAQLHNGSGSVISAWAHNGGELNGITAGMALRGIRSHGLTPTDSGQGGDDDSEAEEPVGAQSNLAYFPPATPSGVIAAAYFTRASYDGYLDAFGQDIITSPNLISASGFDVPSPSVENNVATFGANGVTGRRYDNIPMPALVGESILLSVPFRMTHSVHQQFLAGAGGFSVDYDATAATPVLKIRHGSSTDHSLQIPVANRPAINAWSIMALWITKSANGYELAGTFNGLYFTGTLITATALPTSINLGCQTDTNLLGAERRLRADVRDVVIYAPTEATTIDEDYVVERGGLGAINDRGELNAGLVRVGLVSLASIGHNPNLLPSLARLGSEGDEMRVSDLAGADINLRDFRKFDVVFGISSVAGQVAAALPLISSRLHVINHTADTISAAQANTWIQQNVLMIIGRTRDGAPFLWDGNCAFESSAGVLQASYWGLLGDGTPNVVKRMFFFAHPLAERRIPNGYPQKDIYQIIGERLAT